METSQVRELLFAPDRGIARSTLIADRFHLEDLEIVSAETLAAVRLPIIDMVGRRDGVIRAQAGAAPVIEILPESSGALDGRLAYLLMLVEVVVVAVAADGIHKRSTYTSLFADIIFDERAGRPTIDAEVIIAAAQRTDVIADRVRRSWIPTFARDYIAYIRPGDGEIAGVSSRAGERDVCRAATDVTLPEKTVIRPRAGIDSHCCETRDQRG